MCKFFETKSAVKVGALSTLVVPLAVMLMGFQRNEVGVGVTATTWLIGTITSLGFGYFIGANKPCQLPHIAENVEVEGDGEDAGMAAPADLLPRPSP